MYCGNAVSAFLIVVSGWANRSVRSACGRDALSRSTASLGPVAIWAEGAPEEDPGAGADAGPAAPAHATVHPKSTKSLSFIAASYTGTVIF